MDKAKFYNPFRPTAGAEPPRIIGRDDISLEFVEGLMSGVGAPARLMRITGPRGSGKTVLLCDLRDRAIELGWKAVVVSVGPRLSHDLMEQIQDQLTFSSASLGVNVGIASANNVGIASAKLDISSSEMSLRAKLKQIAQGSKGLFIAVDEVQDAPVEEMRIIASTVQLLIGEKANIALAFAGLPSGVMDLINGKALTFLRRAVPEDLAPINQIEIALSLSDSFNATGLSLDGDLLSKAARATKGYAYLVQLVGYSIWQRANLHREKSTLVSERDVDEGILLAEARFHDVVHEPAISGLSRNEINYLYAMCEDSRQSKTSDLAKRLGKKTSELSSVRAKLLSREVIQAPQRGYVQFAVPDLDEYLKDNRDEILSRY